MTNKTTLIIGANSEIAKALAKQSAGSSSAQLIVISRTTNFYQQSLFSETKVCRVKSYEEEEIGAAVKQIEPFCAENRVTQVFICHGLLHNERCQPEKRLEDFSATTFSEIITANTISPMLWLKHLVPILGGKEICKIVIFTARVGSISDNKLGGWYSYRASKAAMNMLLKSAAVELGRRAKNIKLISFHPGTTDSPLSKPFQSNVPEGKLFNSDDVAKKLLKITQETAVDGDVSFLDWQGKPIPW